MEGHFAATAPVRQFASVGDRSSRIGSPANDIKQRVVDVQRIHELLCDEGPLTNAAVNLKAYPLFTQRRGSTTSRSVAIQAEPFFGGSRRIRRRICHLDANLLGRSSGQIFCRHLDKHLPA